MTVDILYVAKDRLGFTMRSIEALQANTDWDLVNRLVVYDDGSTDGTAEFLIEHGGYADIHRTQFGSPVQIMADYLRRDPADIFVKVDNDIAMPPGWLDATLEVMDANPELELLGLAAGWTGVKSGPNGWEPSSHIGGVGAMRTGAFLGSGRTMLGGEGRFGFTEWQHRWEPVRGWITPDVLAVQLDLVPEEPWQTLKAEYMKVPGLQREWPPYQDRTLWEWINE